MSNAFTGQERAYQFLLKKFSTQDSFTKREFQDATGWDKPGTFDTYWTKQFLPLLVQIDSTHYRVSEVFRRFVSWKKFRLHVTQNRQGAGDYKIFAHDAVMQFEFFMPLSNEAQLRISLDALFYRDSIVTRLKRIPAQKLKHMFAPEEGEDDVKHFERLLRWIAGKFGGYSISHVSGRFRASALKGVEEAYQAMVNSSERYLVDETTAIVRFIFPCGTARVHRFDSPEYLAAEESTDDVEVAAVRFFFHSLFVQSIVEFGGGEDEIWLLESGYENRLYIWRAQNET